MPLRLEFNFLGESPATGLLAHRVVLFLMSVGSYMLFSIIIMLVYIPTNLSAHSSYLFDNRHPNRCEMIDLFVFNFHFPVN